MVKKRFNFFYLEVEAIIEANMNDSDFDILNLSKMLGMSRSQIYRKIKKSTGLSVAGFIRNIRLEKGRKLIQTTDWPIAEIAKEVGFNSTSYFSTSFHKKFGRSPGDFRK